MTKSREIKPFVEMYAPKHQGLEDLKTRILPPKPEVPYKPMGTTAPLPPAPASSLLDFYLNDLRVVQADMQARPDHYDDRQKEVIESLLNKTELARPITAAEKDEIALQYVRDTQLARQSRDSLQRVTNARHTEQEDDAETIMEDGRSLKDHKEDGTAARGDMSFVFQKQNGDKIII